MSTFFLAMAAILMIATALIHSILGERRLIGPLLQSDTAILQVSLARKVLRFAWHLTSLMWVVFAYAMARPVWTDIPIDRDFVLAVGLLHLAVGLFDAVYTRFRHVGWLPLSVVGLFSLLSLIQ